MNYKKTAEELWKNYEPYIRKLCMYKLRSLPDYVEDCVQDVFLDLTDALKKGKTIDYPKAWLTKVAGNKIKDTYTKATKESELFIPLETEYLDKSYSNSAFDEPFFIEEEKISVLKQQVIAMLTETEKELLNDRFVLKKSIRQITTEKNTTENNIYQKLFRLKTKIKMLIIKTINE